VEPVRVRLYGLVSITRRRYLMQLAFWPVLVPLLLAAWWYRWPAARAILADSESESAAPLIAFGDAFPWVVLGAALLQGIEAFFVLRAFARKRASAG
jgi:hypothetical protein